MFVQKVKISDVDLGFLWIILTKANLRIRLHNDWEVNHEGIESC